MGEQVRFLRSEHIPYNIIDLHGSTPEHSSMSPFLFSTLWWLRRRLQRCGSRLSHFGPRRRRYQWCSNFNFSSRFPLPLLEIYVYGSAISDSWLGICQSKLIGKNFGAEKRLRNDTKGCMTQAHSNWTIWSPRRLFLSHESELIDIWKRLESLFYWFTNSTNLSWWNEFFVS